MDKEGEVNTVKGKKVRRAGRQKEMKEQEHFNIKDEIK